MSEQTNVAAPAANALPEMQTPSPFDKLSREELIDRMLTSEHRGWQLAHNKRRCGHPRAFWQDANWPASEDNYDPETHSSDPAMEYRCLICQAERNLAAAQQEIAELLRILKAIFPVKVTMTSDDRINWEVNVRYAGTTGEEIENSIAHAELLGGKK